MPTLRALAAGHLAACHHAERIAPPPARGEQAEPPYAAKLAAFRRAAANVRSEESRSTS
jgi:hypothetical protein